MCRIYADLLAKPIFHRLQPLHSCPVITPSDPFLHSESFTFLWLEIGADRQWRILCFKWGMGHSSFGGLIPA